MYLSKVFIQYPFRIQEDYHECDTAAEAGAERPYFTSEKCVATLSLGLFGSYILKNVVVSFPKLFRIEKVPKHDFIQSR